MNDSDQHNNQDESPFGFLAPLVDSISGVLSLPQSVQRNLIKGLSHLFAIPMAINKGKADEIAATYGSRVAVTKAIGKALAKRSAQGVTLEMGEAALEFELSKILRRQSNIVGVVREAALELSSTSAGESHEPVGEISEDWLNAFESEAVNMSSEQMQKLFGKMLAGEIRRPTAFSIRTVKIMAQMDNDVAVTFRKFCSYTLSFRSTAHQTYLGHTPAIKSSVGPTTWIRPDDLATLLEYGLVQQTSIVDFQIDTAIAGTSTKELYPLIYLDESYILTPIPPKTGADFDGELQYGVGLSRVGNQILRVVAPEENKDFTETLIAQFEVRGLRMDRVTKKYNATSVQSTS